MISELIKKLNIKTLPLLIAILIVLVIAKFIYLQPLDLSIVLLSIYLLILLITRGFDILRNRRQAEECKRNKFKENIIIKNQIYELIWNFFLGLSNQQMQILIDLINLPEAGSKYKRVVQPKTMLMNQLACNNNFQIRIGFNQSLPMLIISCNYESCAPMVVDINHTLYNFTKHYMTTGKKERV